MPPTPTTSPFDVQRRLRRDLADAEEEVLVSVLIDDTENMIRARLPGRVLSAETVDLQLVAQVVAQAVVRVLRNPDGYRSEAVGGVSYTIDTRAAAGFLTILDEEWRLLGLAPLSHATTAGSFAPRLGQPASTPTSWPLLWG